MKSLFSIILICVLFLSCEVYDGPEKIIWVYPYKLAGPVGFSEEGIFYTILESSELDYSAEAWERKNQDFELKDFNFERGYFQKLLVETQDQKSNQEVIWRVKTVLEKRKDYAESIQGNWYSVFLPENPHLPTGLTIDGFYRAATYSSGCWTVTSRMGEVGENTIQMGYQLLRLDYDKLCNVRPGYNPNAIDGTGLIKDAKTYKVNSDGFLDFFDAQGNLSIRFKPLE